MRTLYVFSINDEFKILTRKSPYNLFETFDKIYTNIEKNFDVACNLFDSVICKINKESKNKYLYCKNKDNLFYAYTNSTHSILDYYTNESTNLKIFNTFMKVTTNIDFPSVIRDLTTYENLFVCDFENKDFFWVTDIYNLVVA